MSKVEIRTRVGIATVLLCLWCGGCTMIGAVAAKTLPQNVPPKYVGLQNQSIGVMVWADRAVRIDWERIQLDVANTVQSDLRASGAKELAGAHYPVLPASIVRFQMDHPELESVPATDFATRLGVSRLIYIEIERFSTRSDLTYQLFRGSAVFTLKVIEIDAGAAKVAYEENGITAGFPEKGRPEGELVGTDAAFYAGTVRALAKQVVNRLTTHEAP